MIDAGRYTSGRIAVANLSASVSNLELRRGRDPVFADLLALSDLLFIRGDLLGRIADHDRAELIANEAIALAPDTGTALFICARVAGRFHCFVEAELFLEQAVAAGHPQTAIDAEKATLMQATGRHREAMLLRERLAIEDRGIHTLGARASLLADMGEWVQAEDGYAAALAADEGISPIPCAQLLFEWGVSAMRAGHLERAEEIFSRLDAVLPQHVPGRGHRAEVALARGQVDAALVLVRPLLEVSDDPEYRAVYAQVLSAQGQRNAAAREAGRAAAAFEQLLARRPEAYAHHAAAFFHGLGKAVHAGIDRHSKETLHGHH